MLSCNRLCNFVYQYLKHNIYYYYYYYYYYYHDDDNDNNDDDDILVLMLMVKMIMMMMMNCWIKDCFRSRNLKTEKQSL